MAIKRSELINGLGQVQHFSTRQGYFVGKLLLLQQKAKKNG
ncbi:MAG: hypothetical protein Q9M92_03615 [Enterobacterales bacterium]|nr:hypothetical protein [Enterobacterales bacterium]